MPQTLCGLAFITLSGWPYAASSCQPEDVAQHGMAFVACAVELKPESYAPVSVMHAEGSASATASDGWPVPPARSRMSNGPAPAVSTTATHTAVSDRRLATDGKHAG